MAQKTNPAARQIAYSFLFVLFIASGISLSLTLAGNSALALQVCIGGVVVGVLILVLGSLLVGASRKG